MRVDRISPSRPAVTRRSERSKSTESGGFARALRSDAPASSAIGGAAPVNPVSAVLAAQEVQDSTSGRSRGLRRGFDLLERLEVLRRALIMGTLTVEQIEHLAAQVSSRKEGTVDPALAEILNEIEIRAAVELAKLGR